MDLILMITCAIEKEGPMRKIPQFIFTVFVTIMSCHMAASRSMAEEEDNPIHILLMPAYYASVKGDVQRFRAHTWTNDGYMGGIKDLWADYVLPNDTKMSFEGHYIHGNGDIGADLLLSNENIGDFNVDYHTLRKYYDGSGGSFARFPTLHTLQTNNDLQMDMGHLGVTFAPTLTLGSWHDFVLGYEHHTKDGTKSRLSWGQVVDLTNRSVGPSFQEISEISDIITLQGQTEFAGFDVTARQLYEMTSIDSMRQEQNLDTSSTPSASNLIRQQYQQPSSDTAMTLLHGEKWFNKDKSFVSMAYRFHKINANESEDLYELNSFNGQPTNYGTNAHQRRGAGAETHLDSHTFLGNYNTRLSKDLNFIAKLKTEYIKRDGKSIYPYDHLPGNGGLPDGTIDAIDYSESRQSALIWGQNLGLRYSGIPKTSLYADADVSESRGNIREQQQNITKVLNWERETNTHITKAAWTVGGRYVPISKFYGTLQYRHRLELNKYEDKRDTAGTINSAFVDRMDIISDELSTKLNWKLHQKVQTAFRYQLADRNYTTRVQGQQEQDAKVLSHTFTYDVTVLPVERWLLNLSFSQQNLKTSTAATAYGTADSVPGFVGDVRTLLLGASYTATESLNYTGSAYYSWTDNFDDYSVSGLPLGLDSGHLGVELGAQWRPTKNEEDFLVEPHYGYYSYDADSVVERTAYSAHVLWLDLSLKW